MQWCSYTPISDHIKGAAAKDFPMQPGWSRGDQLWSSPHPWGAKDNRGSSRWEEWEGKGRHMPLSMEGKGG